MSYEVTVSITALCSCCGKALPPNAYLTESKSSTSVFERDNPYERKDRRVFITPCETCFKPASVTNELLEHRKELLEALDLLLNDVGRANSMLGAVKARAAIAKATGGQP